MAYAAWAASTSYAVGAIVRATSVQDFGLVFQCAVAGTSGGSQPAWPTLIDSTTSDGGVTWKAISSVYEDLSVLEPNAIVELFQLHLDATLHGSSDIFYFHNGVNAAVTGNVVWNGQSYVRLALEASGFDYTSSGSLPRPRLAVSNIGSSITALLLQVNLITTGNDLGGAKVVRIRTLKKYLDGQATADVHAKFPDEIWYVDRKSNENRSVVEFELASKFDLVGVVLPRRQIIANVCQWRYRSAECGYTGPPVADANDNYLQGSTNALLNDYLQKATIYRTSVGTTAAAFANLSAAQNNLNTANETYYRLENRYSVLSPRYFVELSTFDKLRRRQRPQKNIWNNAAVSLGSEYRQGSEVVANLYRIERWGVDAGDIAAKQAAYNTALSNYNAAVSAQATALANANAALNAYNASGAVDPADKCGKRLASCNLRFRNLITGESELPFGSFPGAGLGR
jgi:lambda family phage minor tail protein L